MMTSLAHAQKFEANYDESKIASFQLPPVFAGSKGQDASEGDWASRRRELLEAFTKNVYGRVPGQRTVTIERTSARWPILGGIATRHDLDVVIHAVSGSEGVDPVRVHVLIDVPTVASARNPVPAFLGLNFQGNHSTTDDPQVRIPDSWMRDRKNGTTDGNVAIDAGRGVAKSRWPRQTIIERGYALISVYYGDIDPDFDDGFQNGVHSLWNGWSRDLDPPERPGSIAAWAYGLSCILDAVTQQAELGINAAQVAVIGHSRLGKTALWAGATDPRFAMIVSNDSGCGGAALSRRAIGETVGRINTNFPHWFCDKFLRFNENEGELPIDQHLLIAACAPRPVAVGSAEDDRWADPRGEFLSVALAAAAYEACGRRGLVSESTASKGLNSETHLSLLQTHFPDIDSVVGEDALQYHIRAGRHDLTEADWERYIDFADRHLN
ncbi:MAG: acetylxylan esterase [Planctomycetota bacterium]